MTRRLILLGVSGFVLTFPCLTAWLLLPDDHRIVPFLVWLFGVLYLTAVFTVPVAPHEPVGDVPSASPAVQYLTFTIDADTTEAVAAFERCAASFRNIEDAASRRTQLTEGDDG